MTPLQLALLPDRLAICRLDPSAPLPGWAMVAPFYSVTRTSRELSVVAPEASVPEGVRREGPWRALQVQGSLDFSLTGVLASLAQPLARESITVFAISTYDTDVLLVRESDLEAAVGVLRQRGHEVRT